MLRVLVLLVAACHATATTLRVCPNTEASYNTVHEAQTALRSLRSQNNATAIITVELCVGVHHAARSLVLGPEDSHTVWRSAPGDGGRATLDSGFKITDWTVANDGSWRATLPAGIDRSRQMWVSGRRAVRARTESPCITGNITAAGYEATKLSTGCPIGPLGRWIGPGVEFVYRPKGASWTEPRCSVASVGAGAAAGTTTITMDQPCFWMARNKPEKSQSVSYPAWIENAMELLDEPGEWFADYDAGAIYYLPLPGETPTGVTAVLGTVPSGSGGLGSAIIVGPGAHHVAFEGLAFEYQTWLGPSSPVGFVDIQSAFFFLRPSKTQTNLHGVPGALALHGARHVSVTNCAFSHLGLAGVLADGAPVQDSISGSQNINVVGSHFDDLSGSAISLGNVSRAIMTAENQNGNYTVSNCVVSNTGAEYQGSAGVFNGYVAFTDILHNDITNTSNGAICLGWGWGAKNSMRNNRVNYNHITRSNTVLYDCGSIYTLSSQPNSEIAYNYIEHQQLMYGSLYHDAKSAYFHTHHNVVVGGPMWLYLQHGRLGAVNNILVNDNWHNQVVAGGCALPKLAPTCPDNLTVTNNVLVKGSTWPAAAIAIEKAAGVQHQHRPTPRQAPPVSHVAKVVNYDTWPFGNSTPVDYKLWEWTKMTDLITPYLEEQRPEVFALAKQHGVNVITQWHTLDVDAAFLIRHNVTEWDAWIQAEVDFRVRDDGFAGISLDVEHMVQKCAGQPPSCRELLSNFTCRLYDELHRVAPAASLSSALALTPASMSAGYDYKSMSQCLDFFLVMAYSTAGPTTPGSTLAIEWVNTSVAQYASLGIPAKQLVALVPWYGHDWPCDPTQVGVGSAGGIPACKPLPIPPAPFKWEIGYGAALDLLDAHGASFGPAWDEASQSMVAEYRDQGGARHQLWYETPRSLQLKYAAFVQAGVGGVGMWTGSCFHRGDDALSEAAAGEMWAAVPSRLS